MKQVRTNLKREANDNVYVASKIVKTQEITGMPTRRGLEQMVICEDQIVNVCSSTYGHLPNEKFFYEVEHKLISADVKYKTRSINRENKSFAVDYILDDERFHIDVKGGKDIIKPMLRFVNSYDGSNKSTGSFGFFREVCSNGLHVANYEIGFTAKHRGNIIEVVMPELDKLIEKFFDNEFYTLKRKFEILAECPVKDMKDFVKYVLGETGLFKYEKSEKNPEEPSANAQLVIDIMTKETQELGMDANYWLGYNAFNEVLHGKLKKSFTQQKETDVALFDSVMQMARKNYGSY